ncbi:type III polyketide synthase [Deinococcus sp.]|uniref:type III polyketide synthase n=1 Tax=Deinococcus sp. TaxID=47478 RepID=UPI0025F25EA5|nr:type III polyketide synthase [Deinococcus sp.]
MSVYLHAIATAVPETAYTQSELRDIVKSQLPDRRSQRVVGMIYNSSAIEQRHSVIRDLRLAPGAEDGLFYNHAEALFKSPSTGARNALYAQEAPKLFIEAARRALEGCPDLTPADITHVVTVSCTGFYAPGPDYDVVRALGLSPQTQRFHVGFMGCYAAFPALRMARAFCEAQPGAVVLVVCAELCTIHIRIEDDPDTLIASSLFADGASATIVSQRELGAAQKLRMDGFETTLTPLGVGESDMAWKIGDQGFEMILSTYVPDIIESHIQGALSPLLAADALLAAVPYRQIDHWAVHPGGRSILDKVQSSLDLTDTQLAPSREVLRDYGNMSSATILFVLQKLIAEAGDGERICAMAFGPGLTVETGLVTKSGVATAARSAQPELAGMGADD